jgi:flagellar hook assembly protein FlgD
VRTLFDGEMGAGHRSIAWDGRDAVGRPVASGIYFGSLLVDGRAVTRKVIRLP